jgi:hypothetical protein
MHWMTRPIGRRVVPAALALALVVALAAVPTVRAVEESAGVEISATIVEPVEITLEVCDASANFGTRVRGAGSPPLDGADGDRVVALTNGAGTESFYVWTPSCRAQGSAPSVRVSIIGTSVWRLTECFQLKEGSSDLDLSALYVSYGLSSPPTYDQARSLADGGYVYHASSMPCSNAYTTPYTVPTEAYELSLWLRVSTGVTPGTFSAAYRVTATV